MSKKFKGTGVALVTPFHKYGTVDFTGVGNIVDHVINNGVNYLVVLGTTGESATLSTKEKEALVEFVIERNNGRIPVVMGIGGNHTNEIVDIIKKTNFKGVDAILSVSPYYNKPQQRGIIQHYKSISASCPVPIILYNVPGRTGSNMTAETTLQLANEDENIIAVKEASGNFAQIMQIIKNKPEDFLVISGDDALTLPLISVGVDGVISVVANAYPKEFSQMVELALDGKFKKASKIHYNLLDLIDALFADGSPAGVKAVLDDMNLCANYLRPPLTKVTKTHHAYLKTLMDKLKEVEVV